MVKISVNVNVLLSMLHFAGKDDARHYINGVFIDLNEPGFIRYVATNGHCLGIYRDTAMQDENESPPKINLIIGREILAKFKKHKSIEMGELIIFDIVITDTVVQPRKCRLNYAGTSINFAEVKGKFPNHLRVAPVTYSGESGFFDPSVLIPEIHQDMIGECQKNIRNLEFILGDECTKRKVQNQTLK